MQTFYNELEDEAIESLRRRVRDIAEVDYFLREPKARTRADALAAWERIKKGNKYETQ